MKTPATKAAKNGAKQKVRITLDLTPDAYSRLNDLSESVGADSKANLIRQALQLYEYVAKRHREGYEFRAVKDGKEETIVFLGPVG